ncbi:metallophosphoesterase family protein [Glycocaulis profundi]|nr:metallophosphoesterase family protein [Glycocaulis profundi]
MRHAAALSLALFAAPAALADPVALPNPPAPHAPGEPYRPKGAPDRIILNAGADSARQAAVTWRTDARQETARLQLVRAVPGPAMDEAEVLEGETRPLETENGLAHHHGVRLDGLEPGTAYSYRVEGADGWSGWIDFRTASETNDPFQIIYFGDVQNYIGEVGWRVMRQAFRHASNPALVAQAGDFVSSRDDMVHDDEWGQWWDGGGLDFASVPHIPAAGNHEFIPGETPDGDEIRVLGHHWPLQFLVPENGAEGVESTSFYIDHQGVRFVVPDATAAISLDQLDNQSDWLRRVLSEAPGDWTVVVMHQPVITCARPDNMQPMYDAWKPIFEETGVDLVLQGHDHCYGRWTDPGNPRRPGAEAASQDQPVYVVSVVGGKMYALNDRVADEADRWAEGTQLYQLIDFAPDAIGYAAYTAQGELYDAFELRREADGSKTLSDDLAALPEIRVCQDEDTGPDGFACTSRGK